MSLPDIEMLYAVLEATWPAASSHRDGVFRIRDGQGGGKRVEAATAEESIDEAALPGAESAMRALGQTPLFMIREGDEVLDSLLAAQGYQVIDPVNIYAAPVADLLEDIPHRTVAIPAWEPLQIMCEIWATGGIGPARIEVMRRASSPKTGLLSRWNDKPGGTAFIAMHEGISMLHALEVLPSQRRQGLAYWTMRRAATWTQAQGGHTLSVICTQANDAANGLYSRLGMTLVGRYHYRIKPE